MSLTITSVLDTLSIKSPKYIKSLIDQLNLSSFDQPKLEAVLKILLDYDMIKKNAEGGYLLIKDTLKGTLIGSAQKFAFVEVELSDAANIFIDESDLNGANHRDRVEIELYYGEDGRLRGKVLEILDRGTKSFVGTYRVIGASVFVFPQDPKLPIQIPVESGFEFFTDGQIVASYIHYGNQGKALARPYHPIDTTDPQGILESVILNQGILLHLPKAVEEFAQSIPKEISAQEIARRKDLRSLPFVTIDPEDAKDFDDAIFAQARENGGWDLWVAIADVSHYVTDHNPIDEEARQRGATLYLPAQAFPMLPHELANDLCSLKPRVDRLAMVAKMLITPKGDIDHYELYEAVIHSHARFTYDQAATLIGILPPQALPENLLGFKEQLSIFRDCTRSLRFRRQRRGFLNLEMPEPRLSFDEEGQVIGFRVPGRHEAHLMVEEAMLAANEAMAMMCIALNLPAVYRIHPNPPELAFQNFSDQAVLLGAPLDIEKEPKPLQLSKYLKSLESHPNFELINMIMLRAMSKAVYSPKPELHYGLGTSTYLHFTSPIRRYPDLWVHRQLKRYLNGLEALDDLEAAEVASQSSRNERLVVDAERRVMDAYKALYMQQHLGEFYEGIICQVSAKGLSIQLDGLPIWATVNVEGLGLLNDYFVHVEKEYAWVGTSSNRLYQLGQRVKVQLVASFPGESQILVHLVESAELDAFRKEKLNTQGYQTAFKRNEKGNGQNHRKSAK